MAILENPNKPRQPQKGVYAWYARKEGRNLVIYIGQAGYKDRQKDTYLQKGTLFRGVSELQRATFSQDYTLDTDFIVGTAIIFFEKHGYKCIWKHISNNPEEERRFIASEHPLLQNRNGRVKNVFKVRKETKDYWKLKGMDENSKQQKIKEAELEIFKELSNMLKNGGSGGI
ncbi:MAG: hypothetical protein JXA17_08215 [Dehalococcoidales bacterium]|nr:hypothetical protein [Dehalococcoidales bacterium]